MIYAAPGTEGAKVTFKPRYENFIGGDWVAPVNGRYFANHSPVDGSKICDVPRSDEADINLALDAAHKAAISWGKTSVTERANLLLKIADRIDANTEMLAIAETWDNGKPVRETLAADIPLSADHFRYFAGCIRAQEGTMAELDSDTVAYHVYEPLGVVFLGVEKGERRPSFSGNIRSPEDFVRFMNWTFRNGVDEDGSIYAAYGAIMDTYY
ncbi:MAG: aldehyde dehydrogenase family protein, partial [Gammaproteobacteria bacterium]